jgi:hypothetical protein
MTAAPTACDKVSGTVVMFCELVSLNAPCRIRGQLAGDDPAQFLDPHAGDLDGADEGVIEGAVRVHQPTIGLRILPAALVDAHQFGMVPDRDEDRVARTDLVRLGTVLQQFLRHRLLLPGVDLRDQFRRDLHELHVPAVDETAEVAGTRLRLCREANAKGECEHGGIRQT